MKRFKLAKKTYMYMERKISQLYNSHNSLKQNQRRWARQFMLVLSSKSSTNQCFYIANKKVYWKTHNCSLALHFTSATIVLKHLAAAWMFYGSQHYASFMKPLWVEITVCSSAPQKRRFRPVGFKASHFCLDYVSTQRKSWILTKGRYTYFYL